LIEQLGGVSIPAVGIAFGFDRMVEAAEFFNRIPPETTGTVLLITIFAQKTAETSLKLASQLRKNQINSEIYPEITKLDKQLKYADKKGIPYVVIIGPDEIKKNVVKLKNMKTLGILGGIGPQTTSKIYLSVIDSIRKKGAEKYPPIVIYNLPFPFVIENEAIVQGINSEKMISYLIDGAKILEKSG